MIASNIADNVSIDFTGGRNSTPILTMSGSLDAPTCSGN